MKEKFNFGLFMVAAVMMVVTLFVSCAPQSHPGGADETVSIFFGKLQAKAIDDVYDTEYYGDITSNTVDPRTASDYFWAYKATKADNDFKSGETSGFVPVIEGDSGKGLDTVLEGFSKGKWDFELRAFTTNADRTNGTNIVFEGSTKGIDLKSADLNTVSIAVDYAYSNGKGTVKFNIDVNIDQVLPSTSGTTTTYYKVTKVKAYAGSVSADLTQNSSTSGRAYSGNWSGSVLNVPYGLVETKYEVYVDNEDTPRATIQGTSAVLTNLETTIKATATIALAESIVNVSLNSVTLPALQPYVITNGTDANNNAITWKTLTIDTVNKRALVISEKVLETKAFNSNYSIIDPRDPYYGVTGNAYKDSTLRTYLNGDFITTYNINTDKMLKVDVISGDAEIAQFDDSSSDKIFLLSATEVETYFGTAANAFIAYDLNGDVSDWWIRTSYFDFDVLFVDEYGDIDYDDVEAKTSGGVRPAFWYQYE